MATAGGGGGGGGREEEAAVTLQHIASGGFLILRKRAAQEGASPALPHRGAAVSRTWELALSQPTDATRPPAAAIVFDEPFAEYPSTAFWSVRPPTDASPAAADAAPPSDAPGVRPFLLMPLNEVQDEHYTVYFCKPASSAEARKPPRFCV